MVYSPRARRAEPGGIFGAAAAAGCDSDELGEEMHEMPTMIDEDSSSDSVCTEPCSLGGGDDVPCEELEAIHTRCQQHLQQQQQALRRASLRISLCLPKGRKAQRPRSCPPARGRDRPRQRAAWRVSMPARMPAGPPRDSCPHSLFAHFGFWGMPQAGGDWCSPPSSPRSPSPCGEQAPAPSPGLSPKSRQWALRDRRASTPPTRATWERLDRTPSPPADLVGPLSASFSGFEDFRWRSEVEFALNGPSSGLQPPAQQLQLQQGGPFFAPVQQTAGQFGDLDPASAAPGAAVPPAGGAHPELPPPPCDHNNWDNVRTKKGRFALRCRECAAAWRVPCASVAKCPAFFYGYCPNGRQCPLPHIHKYKNREREVLEAKRQAMASIAARKAAQDVATGVADPRSLESNFAAPCAVLDAAQDTPGGTPVLPAPQGQQSPLFGPPTAGAPPAAAPPAAAPAAKPPALLDGWEPPPERPCEHNNWDAVKLAKGRITLRCRACGSFWKAPAKSIVKCPDFFAGYCPAGAECAMPHVHRYKNPQKEAEKARLAAQACMRATSVAGGGEELTRAVMDGSSFAAPPGAFTESGAACPAREPRPPGMGRETAQHAQQKGGARRQQQGAAAAAGGAAPPQQQKRKPKSSAPPAQEPVSTRSAAAPQLPKAQPLPLAIPGGDWFGPVAMQGPASWQRPAGAPAPAPAAANPAGVSAAAAELWKQQFALWRQSQALCQAQWASVWDHRQRQGKPAGRWRAKRADASSEVSAPSAAGSAAAP